MFQKSRVRFGSAVVALVLLATSCGGGDSESSNRQRNTALTPCVTATVGEGLEIGTSGANVEVAIGVCSGVTSIQFIDESTNNVSAPSPAGEDSTTPLNIEVPALTEASPIVQRKVTVRAFGLGLLIAEDVVTLTVSETGAVSVAVTPGAPSESTTETTTDVTSTPLVGVKNLQLVYKSTIGQDEEYELSFTYFPGELERIDGFAWLVRSVGSETAIHSATLRKDVFIVGDNQSYSMLHQFRIGMFQAGMTYEVAVTPYVESKDDPTQPLPESSATTVATFVAASGEPNEIVNPNPDPNTTNSVSSPQSPTEPQTPTDLKLSDGETRVLTWVPDRTSETSYDFDAEKYPYRYRINWRPTDIPSDSATFFWYADSAEYRLNPYEYVADKQYEFTVQEVTEDLTSGVSDPSAPLVIVPFTTADFERIRAAEAAAIEKSRLAAVECMKTAPQLELLLRDPNSRTVDANQPVNSDDEVMFGVLHPCETDVEAALGFNVREIDPLSRRVYSDRFASAAIDGVTIELGNGRLAPGPHTFIVQTRWRHGDPFETDNAARDSVPSTEWTIEVLAGSKPFVRRCAPDNVIIVDRKLTVTCDGVYKIKWRDSDVNQRDIRIDVNNREVTLPVFPDGWHQFGLDVFQRDFEGIRYRYMVCLRNCENAKLEPEFTATVEGDVVKVGLKQNDCGGDASARISEYIKITDNLFYSLNKAFGVSPTPVPNGETVEVFLPPFTEAISASREDHCGRREQVVHSFMKISRPKVAPLDLEKLELPPQTSAEVNLDELLTAEQKNISVPANTETITVPSDVATTLAPAGGTVTVSVDSGEPKNLIDGFDLSLALPPTAKSITFKVTDPKGRVTQVTKPIVRQPETEIVQVVEDAGQTVPKVEATPASEVSDTSGLSPLTLVLIALVVLVLALIAFQFVRRKA
jgi:hypothetical protein